MTEYDRIQQQISEITNSVFTSEERTEMYRREAHLMKKARAGNPDYLLAFWKEKHDVLVARTADNRIQK